MPSRRVKSIMHGSAEDTRVYHREHRSKGGRKGRQRIRSGYWSRRRKENRKKFVMDFHAQEIMKEFNFNKKFRKKITKDI